MSLKQFRFTVENLRTHESCAFIGDGCTLEEAVKDGVKNANGTFRPKNDGVSRPSMGFAVTLKNHEIVTRSVSEFESDEPFTNTQPTEDLF